MKKILTLIICLLVIAGSILIVDGLARQQRSTPVETTIFLSCDTRGYLEPCGCKVDQAGGIIARSAYINQSKQANALLLDAGNLSSGMQAHELLKLTYLMKSMSAMGYDAVNLGESDVELGKNLLQKGMAESNLPFVSANILDSETRQLLTEPYRIINRNGLKIGIIGVADLTNGAAGEGLMVRPPLEALADHLPKLKRSADCIIALCFADRETLANIARNFPEINLILGGNVEQSFISAEPVNQSVLFAVSDLGKVLGRIQISASSVSFSVQSAESVKLVQDKLPPSPSIQPIIDEYKEALKERRFEFAQKAGMVRINAQSNSFDFSGSAICAKCHADEYKVWHESKHQRALTTLIENNHEYDPDCLVCHTVGYGLKTGYASMDKTPLLGGVQCENCHGGGKQHVLDKNRRSLKPITPAVCEKCHDKENSANFNYKIYWEKIKH